MHRHRTHTLLAPTLPQDPILSSIFAQPPSSLPYSGAPNNRASTENINLHELLNSNMRVAKNQRMHLHPRVSFVCVRAFPPSHPLPRPPPSAHPASSFSPELPESKILTEVNILIAAACVSVSKRKLSVQQKASLFLLWCGASLRAFLDAGAFE